MIRSTRLIMLIALLLGAAGAEETAAVKEARRHSDGQLQRLIDDLAADDYEMRESATSALVAMGEKAIPHLEHAMQSPDAEVVWRAEAAMQMIRWQITPQMWSRIGDLMKLYEQSDADTRERMVRIVRMIAEHDSIPVLRSIIRRDEGQAVRQTAAMMLADLGSDGLAALMEEGVEIAGLDPYDARVHIIIGNSFLTDGNYLKAESHYRKALELEPANYIAMYNMACVYSLEMKIDEAFIWLEKSIEAGYDDFEWMEKDTDLDNIREDERYKEILRRGPRPGHLPEIIQ